MHHFDIASIVGGATVFGIVAHAVNTFPQPTNAYAKWLLGTVQFAVGQRMQAQRTMSAAPFEDAVGTAQTPVTAFPSDTSTPPTSGR